MSTIQELEQKVKRLEQMVIRQEAETTALLSKSDKALDVAMNAYRIDHAGYVWVWDKERSQYRKTDVCVRVIIPKVKPKEITNTKIGDKAVNNRTLDDGCVDKRVLAKRSVGTDNLLELAIITKLLADLAVTNEKLADDAVQTRNIKDRNVTSSKIKKGAILPEHFTRETLVELHKDLQNQIDSFNEHGLSVSNEFGSDPHIGISQKTLTDAINKIWQKLEDITGEVFQGINMVVTPTFFVSEDGCDIHVSANTIDTNGLFEKIQFFVDGEVIYDATNTGYVSFDHHLDIKETYDYVVMCKAKIMGIEYIRQQIITRYNEFYIGAGSTYADVMDSAHARQLNGTMRHNYDITFDDGKKLIIVMGASLRPGFIRADLNGAEIEFTEQTVLIDGKQYVVLTSEPWSAGDYNIDING